MKRDRDGFLLITTLLALLAIGILVLGVLATSLVDRQVSASQRDSTQAYYIAQTGLERLRTAAFTNFVDIVNAGGGDACTLPLNDSLDLGGGLTILPGAFTEPQAVGNGTYRVQYAVVNDRLILISEGSVGRGQATVQSVAQFQNPGQGPYINAVTAEHLQSSSNANFVGRVAVFGSVHVVNDGVDLTTEDTAFGISGNAGVFNNYYGDGNTATGGNNIFQNAAAVLGGSRADLQDLCTRVKIDSGNLYVNKGAAANLGAPTPGIDDQEDNPNAIQGLYFGGSADTPRGRLVEKDGHSLRDILPTPEYGVYQKNDGLGYYESYATQIPELPAEFPLDRIGEGPSVYLTPDSSCPLVSEVVDNKGNSLGHEVRLPPENAENVITCSGDGIPAGSISYDPDTDTLSVTGDVNISGMNVVMDPDSGTTKVSGTGSLRVNGNVTVNGGIEPVDANTFYTESGSNFGIMASDTVTLNTTASDPNIAAIVYAGEKIQLGAQSVVFGSLLSKVVVTEQVPRIAYHPDVSAAAERLGMPGTGEEVSVGELSVFSFERVGQQ